MKKTARKFANKHELYDFYIKILHSVEQIKFNVNVKNEDFGVENTDLALEYIINFEEIDCEEKEKEIHDVLVSKFGKPFFCKEIFSFVNFSF